MRVLLLGLVLLLTASACRVPTPQPPLVAVREFVIADGAKLRPEAASDATLGNRFAQMVVARLRHRGRLAEVVPATGEVNGDLLLIGRMTQVVWGGTFAVFGVDGEVRRPDGSRVAVFSEERVGTGFTNAGAVENAMIKVRDKVGDMVIEGKYTGGRPGDPGVPKQTDSKAKTQAEVVRPVSDRLRELDELRSDGLISESEYDDRRKKILDDL